MTLFDQFFDFFWPVLLFVYINCEQNQTSVLKIRRFFFEISWIVTYLVLFFFNKLAYSFLFFKFCTFYTLNYPNTFKILQAEPQKFLLSVPLPQRDTCCLPTWFGSESTIIVAETTCLLELWVTIELPLPPLPLPEPPLMTTDLLSGIYRQSRENGGLKAESAAANPFPSPSHYIPKFFNIFKLDISQWYCVH